MRAAGHRSRWARRFVRRAVAGGTTALLAIGFAVAGAVPAYGAGSLTTTGAGIEPQSVSVTIPAGSSVTLVDADGDPADSVPVAGQGRYDLNRLSGVITFTPVPGFLGAATPVRYRVASADDQSKEGSYTPTVMLPPAPEPVDVSSTGTSETQSVRIPIPPGGSITLLDGEGQPVTSLEVPRGIFGLDPTTGVISHTPIFGEHDGWGVSYRVTDAYGQSATASYTAVVEPYPLWDWSDSPWWGRNDPAASPTARDPSPTTADRLPFTGAGTPKLLAAALILITVGSVLVRATRRPRDRARH